MAKLTKQQQKTAIIKMESQKTSKLIWGLLNIFVAPYITSFLTVWLILIAQSDIFAESMVIIFMIIRFILLILGITQIAQAIKINKAIKIAKLV